MNDTLARLDAKFGALCTDSDRPSIPPERQIRVGLLQILFSVRPKGQLMEQMDSNLMFHWFVGVRRDRGRSAAA